MNENTFLSKAQRGICPHCDEKNRSNSRHPNNSNCELLFCHNCGELTRR